MVRPTDEELKNRYGYIKDIITSHGEGVKRPNGNYDIPKIRKILKSEYNHIISERRLYDVIYEGRGGVIESDPSGVSVNMNALIHDFKEAIGVLRKIIGSSKTPSKEKLEAMRVLRPLELDLVKLVNDINKAELEKATLNRPIVVLKFGEPTVIDKELLMKKKVKEDA